jgi:transcriptional regulator with XRE-family HTH domain
MDYEALGKRIRNQRRLLGMTQEELSERVGVSCSFIGHIERGSRKLSLETLVHISDALNISCDALLQDSLNSDRSLETTGMTERNRKLLNEIASVLREGG